MDGKLHLNNKVNWEQFRVLIVPSCQTISFSNLKKIEAFYKTGGKVIFTTQLPAFSAEFGKDEQVRRIMKTFAFNGEVSKSKSFSGEAVFIAAPNGLKIKDALQRFGIPFDVNYAMNSDLRYIHKVVDGKDIYYFANTGNSEINAQVALSGKQSLEKWDPHTGAISQVDGSYEGKTVEHNTLFQLQLSPFKSLFYISKH